jgi:hypothetical protein
MTQVNLKAGGFALFFALLLSGCSGLARQPAVPEALQDQAHVPGLEGVRYRGGEDIAAMAHEGIEALRREQAYLASQGHRGPPRAAAASGISGDIRRR